MTTNPVFTLLPDEVHVWHVPLGELVPQMDWRYLLLSQEERARLTRFHHERDHNEFCLSRSTLRLLLEAYGVAPAAEIDFACSARGKPALATVHDCHWLQFNLSHTRGMAVYAFAHSRPVGVDIELTRAVPDADRIVASHFAAEEKAEYRMLPASARQHGFLNAWTRKEAFVKALGEGLNYPLDAFAVSLTPGEPARLVRIGEKHPEVAKWLLVDLTIDPSYVVALAVLGAPVRLRNRLLRASREWHEVKDLD